MSRCWSKFNLFYDWQTCSKDFLLSIRNFLELIFKHWVFYSLAVRIEYLRLYIFNIFSE